MSVVESVWIFARGEEIGMAVGCARAIADATDVPVAIDWSRSDGSGLVWYAWPRRDDDEVVEVGLARTLLDGPEG